MTKQRTITLKKGLRVLTTALLALLLGGSYPGPVFSLRAQTPSKARASSQSGPPKEGIKVHGHWTIDIRNPDGKLVTHREFENGLQGDGHASLGQFLQRTFKAGEWFVNVGGTFLDANNPCMNGASEPRPCLIYEPASAQAQSSESNAFKTLTIASQGGILNNTVLAGTAKAQKDGTITFVSTALSHCPVDTQGVCGDTSITFTSTGLATPINLVKGQIIQVTVVISFS